MFKKILIANRGEIACRVIQTATAMNIQTVAVYSSADIDAKHSTLADEIVFIGDSAAAQSYLAIDKIVDACKQTGAEAVHPGYGFLSENAAFAKALHENNICFIGPDTTAIEVMGDKIQSKRLAEKAGVNTIPGYTDVVEGSEHAVTIARNIGYPVMIKASAGGGGKGMRVAYDDQQVREGFERATNEAISSFADDRIFIEKFIEQPRHIEVQIIADKHDNVIALYERECSIQRRHQKIIEEAPSAFLDEKTRKQMCEQAKSLARAVNYCSAGTVEFIVHGNGDFYFLEMNTRLQVEHPVTELITGVDLVELMIKVANGEPLPITQEQVCIKGWSMESRVYAENPFRDFLPSVGRLKKYKEPQGENIRVDSGVVEGSDISVFYDPMISKLVTWGENREQAIAKMLDAMQQYTIDGVETNLPFLFSIYQHEKFCKADITTNFIAEEYPDGFQMQQLPQSKNRQLLSIIASIHYRLMQRATTICNQSDGFSRKISSNWVVVDGNNYHPVEVKQNGQCWQVSIDQHVFNIRDQWLVIHDIYQGEVDKNTVKFRISGNKYGFDVTMLGCHKTLYVLSPSVAELYKLMPEKNMLRQSNQLLSPMPGLLVSLKVSVGQEVKAGEELAIVEAMKMENSLRAECDAIIDVVLEEVGSTLEVGQPILQFR